MVTDLSSLHLAVQISLCLIDQTKTFSITQCQLKLTRNHCLCIMKKLGNLLFCSLLMYNHYYSVIKFTFVEKRVWKPYPVQTSLLVLQFVSHFDWQLLGCLHSHTQILLQEKFLHSTRTRLGTPSPALPGWSRIFH